MKAQKDWYAKYIKKAGYNRSAKHYTEDGWRAGLEEVLTQLNNIYDGDFENSEIVEWIEGELNAN